MPGRSGLDLLKQLREVLPDLHVLVVSMHDSMPMQSQCLRAGAAGFVSKSGDPESVVRAVRAVQSGLRTLHPNMHSQAQAAPHERLTARELEVVQFLIMGLGIDAIAVRLGVSEKTVSNYQTLVRHKLSVSNSVELVHYAQTHGLIP
jgi:DNA-binding NarL/FixJ family response regulator